MEDAVKNDYGLKGVKCVCGKAIKKNYLKKNMKELYGKFGGGAKEEEENKGESEPKQEEEKKCRDCGAKAKKMNIGCECIYCADCLIK